MKDQASHIHIFLLDYSGSYAALSAFTASQETTFSVFTTPQRVNFSCPRTLLSPFFATKSEIKAPEQRIPAYTSPVDHFYPLAPKKKVQEQWNNIHRILWWMIIFKSHTFSVSINRGPIPRLWLFFSTKHPLPQIHNHHKIPFLFLIYATPPYNGSSIATCLQFIYISGPRPQQPSLLGILLLLYILAVGSPIVDAIQVPSTAILSPEEISLSTVLALVLLPLTCADLQPPHLVLFLYQRPCSIDLLTGLWLLLVLLQHLSSSLQHQSVNRLDVLCPSYYLCWLMTVALASIYVMAISLFI